MATIRGKNEGTIFRKPNGKWGAQVSINGKRLSRVLNSRTECQNWIRSMLNQIDRGMTFESQTLTLGEFLKGWIANKKNTLRPKPAVQYEQLIKSYIVPLLGKTKLKDLNLQAVNRFYERLRDWGIGISNIRYSHRVLHSALEQALIEGLIIRNPTHGATVPRIKYREMMILNDEQVGLFLISASVSRYMALYHLAATTGMRLSELRGLCWSDVNWIRGAIKVNRQIEYVPGQGSISSAPKTYSGIRTILLGETTLNVLREQKRRNESEMLKAGSGWKDNELIFPSSIGTPFSDANVRKDFVNVLKDANLPRIRFHDLRHTAASLMLNHNVPVLVVSKILGHSNPSVTLNIYAHSTIDMQSMAAGIMDKIVTPIPINLSQLHTTARDNKK